MMLVRAWSRCGLSTRAPGEVVEIASGARVTLVQIMALGCPAASGQLLQGRSAWRVSSLGVLGTFYMSTTLHITEARVRQVLLLLQWGRASGQVVHMAKALGGKHAYYYHAHLSILRLGAYLIASWPVMVFARSRGLSTRALAQWLLIVFKAHTTPLYRVRRKPTPPLVGFANQEEHNVLYAKGAAYHDLSGPEGVHSASMGEVLLTVIHHARLWVEDALFLLILRVFGRLFPQVVSGTRLTFAVLQCAVSLAVGC